MLLGLNRCRVGAAGHFARRSQAGRLDLGADRAQHGRGQLLGVLGARAVALGPLQLAAQQHQVVRLDRVGRGERRGGSIELLSLRTCPDQRDHRGVVHPRAPAGDERAISSPGVEAEHRHTRQRPHERLDLTGDAGADLLAGGAGEHERGGSAQPRRRAIEADPGPADGVLADAGDVAGRLTEQYPRNTLAELDLGALRDLARVVNVASHGIAGDRGPDVKAVLAGVHRQRNTGCGREWAPK